jgi:hypothetical protein
VIVRAILGGPNGRIAVAYYEWSDSWMQKLLIDWTLLDSEASIAAFAQRLADAPISIARRTSISGAIRYAIPLFGRSPYEPTRKVLDISGDGSNNDGGLVTDMRHEALKERIAINGLPIMNDRPNPFGFPNEDRPRRVLPALRDRRPALLRRGGAQLRGFPPRRAQEAAAGGGRPGALSRHEEVLRPGVQLAQAGTPGCRRARLHQVRPARLRARLRRGRTPQPRVLAEALRRVTGLTGQSVTRHRTDTELSRDGGHRPATPPS